MVGARWFPAAAPGRAAATSTTLAPRSDENPKSFDSHHRRRGDILVTYVDTEPAHQRRFCSRLMRSERADETYRGAADCGCFGGAVSVGAEVFPARAVDYTDAGLPSGQGTW